MQSFVGVPGCGKSTLISQSVNFNTLIVCLTRAPVEEIRNLVAIQHKSRVKTIENTLKYKPPKFNTLIIDEAQMIDFDSIIHLINKPVQIILYGDQFQVSNVLMNSIQDGLVEQTTLLDRVQKESTQLNHTYRISEPWLQQVKLLYNQIDGSNNKHTTQGCIVQHQELTIDLL